MKNKIKEKVLKRIEIIKDEFIINPIGSIMMTLVLIVWTLAFISLII